MITKTYDLILWPCNHTSKFPRNHRFVLGERIERNLYWILETLIRAKYTKNRQRLLEDANLALEVLPSVGLPTRTLRRAHLIEGEGSTRAAYGSCIAWMTAASGSRSATSKSTSIGSVLRAGLYGTGSVIGSTWKGRAGSPTMPRPTPFAAHLTRAFATHLVGANGLSTERAASWLTIAPQASS